MDVWTKDCMVMYKSIYSPGKIVITTDHIRVNLEKRKHFGLVYDGFEEIQRVGLEDITEITIVGIPFLNKHIKIITREEEIELNFNQNLNIILKEILSNIKLAKDIEKRRKYSIKSVLKNM